jgi:hypothetical protein
MTKLTREELLNEMPRGEGIGSILIDRSILKIIIKQSLDQAEALKDCVGFFKAIRSCGIDPEVDRLAETALALITPLA